MSKVIFLMNVPLDGYIETPDHSPDWTIVDDELLAWVNERTRSIEANLLETRTFSSGVGAFSRRRSGYWRARQDSGARMA